MNDAITLNGHPIRIEHTTLDQLVAARIPDTRRIAVALNGAVVPRGAWSETRLHAGDRVEIVKLTVGG
jgi:sulfur carrier protein